MAGILSTLGRGNQKKDPMRESAALTTVYLLEQNQKFERFMQQKVDDLESRVAAQQARLSTREEAEERELWAVLEAGDEIDGVTVEPEPVDDGSPADEPEFEAEDGWSGWNEPSPTPPDDEESLEHIAAAEPEAAPDYLALMGGVATEPGGNVAVAAEKQRDTREAYPAPPPYLEPEDSTVLVASPPEDASVIGDENEASPTHTSDASPTAVEMGNDPWPDQYEAFQVAWPDGDEVDDLWPDVDVADGVELLAGQTAIDDDKALPAGSESPTEYLTRPGEPTRSQPEDEPSVFTPLSDEEVLGDGTDEVNRLQEMTVSEINETRSVEPEMTNGDTGVGLESEVNEISEVGAETTDDPAGLEIETVNLPETSIAAEALDQAGDDEAEPWQSALPAGQKDEWS